MEYREALHIGSKADGVIKCTYATIYDAQGNKLFSLQNVNAQYYIEQKEEDDYGRDITITQLAPDVYFANNPGFQGTITMKIPLVQVDTISDNNRFIPAKLTAEAKELIINACRNVKIERYIIKALVPTQNGEEKQIVIQTTYTMPEIEQLNQIKAAKNASNVWIDKEKVLSPRYEKLAEVLGSNQTIYIKPAAFDWHAVDITNATIVDQDGKTIDLDASIAQAKKKMDTAKALLAGAAITNIF